MMKITGLSHLFKWENLHNWWLTKYFFAPLYIQTYRKTDRQTDRQVDRQTDRPTDRQTIFLLSTITQTIFLFIHNKENICRFHVNLLIPADNNLVH